MVRRQQNVVRYGLCSSVEEARAAVRGPGCRLPGPDEEIAGLGVHMSGPEERRGDKRDGDAGTTQRLQSVALRSGRRPDQREGDRGADDQAADVAAPVDVA